MRLATLLAAIGLSVSSFASDIPEARKLHPDLYTIQFTLALLNDDFKMPDCSTSSAPTTKYVQPAGDPKSPDAAAEASAVIVQIRKSNPKYAGFATIHLNPGDEFSDGSGALKGMWDARSNTLKILKLELPEFGIEKPITVTVDDKQWNFVFLSDGKGKRYCLLVKSYGPTK